MQNYLLLNLAEGNISKSYNLKIIRKTLLNILYVENNPLNTFSKLKCFMNAFSLLHEKIKFQFRTKHLKVKNHLCKYSYVKWSGKFT